MPYNYWMAAREEKRLTASGELADVLACLQAGAAWKVKRDGRHLAEGPPERRQPGAMWHREGAEVQYLWPTTTDRVWADLEREREERRHAPDHAFWSSTRSDFCTAWIGSTGAGRHCGRRQSEHAGALR